MENFKAIQAHLLDQIKKIDGGWATLSETMQVTEQNLRAIVLPKGGRTPRLASLEKIKKGIEECLEKQRPREQALLS